MHAHGTGVSIEKIVGEYLVDIGYTPEEVEEGTQVRFDFLLFENASGGEEEFTDIWVRIEKEGKLLFAGGIAKPVFGTTGLSYSFLDHGEYEVFVRYQNGKEALVETTVPFSVAEQEKTFSEKMFPGTHVAMVGVICLLVGVALMWGVARVIAVPSRKIEVATESDKPSVVLESALYVGIGLVIAIGAFFLFSFIFNTPGD